MTSNGSTRSKLGDESLFAGALKLISIVTECLSVDKFFAYIFECAAFNY